MEPFSLALLNEKPFRVLVQEHSALAERRRESESKSEEDRRAEAEWIYYADVAGDIWAQGTGESHESGLGAVYALAIDPQFGPGLLTVGSIEYQLGRIDEAMEMFIALVRLPSSTTDFEELVDQAGTFLTESDDFANAEVLFGEAVRRHPEAALFHSALGYCRGKQGQTREAVEPLRRAVELDPGNHEYLSDLGWGLIEAKTYDEAEEVLKAAIAAAPTEEKSARARANLRYLHDRRDRPPQSSES